MSHAVTDFQQDVLERSKEKPVVVDFWAPWCGPCRQLGPILESLAEEQQERWTLVKLNVDDHPELAQQYNVRGIPAVKLFVDGEIVDDFTGALPRHAIQNWLNEAIPTKSKNDMQQAREALQERNVQVARDLLYDILREDPDNGEAQVLLAQSMVFDDPDKAVSFANNADVAQPALLQKKESIQMLADLLRGENTLPKGDGKNQYKKALASLRDERFSDALDHFIAVINTDRYYADDAARKACVALFTILGNDHPEVKSHRRRFDMALY